MCRQLPTGRAFLPFFLSAENAENEALFLRARIFRISTLLRRVAVNL